MFSFFFKEYYKQYDFEIKLIHELKHVRNLVSYEGFFVSKDYIERNKNNFENAIIKLKKLVEGKMK